ncbi:phytase, partial [Escherichia coli]|nr:phytase [Escherichia coli]
MLLATLMLLQTAPVAAAQDMQAVTTAEVKAIGETQAVASLEDAADDPAIWRNARDPKRSLIVATDKKAGLNVYDL